MKGGILMGLLGLCGLIGELLAMYESFSMIGQLSFFQGSFWGFGEDFKTVEVAVTHCQSKMDKNKVVIFGWIFIYNRLLKSGKHLRG